MSRGRIPSSSLVLAVVVCVAWASACGSKGNSDTGGPDGGSSGGDSSVAGDGPSFFADSSGGSSGSSGGSSGNFSSSGSDGATASSIVFKPASATIVVTGTGTQTANFTLEAIDASGNAFAVTPDSVQFDRPDLATVTDGQPVVATAPSLSTPYAGTGTIHAIYKGQSATATLTVQVHLVDYGPGVTSMSPGVPALNGANLPNDPAPGISPLLYPYDKTVWPLGLTSPLVMWNAPQAGDIYRMHYAEKNYSFDGYYTLSALPGQLRLDQGAWDRITASSDAKNGPDPLTFTLSRWDHVANAAYTSSTQTWTIAPESLQGAIYYWTASQDAMGVRRGHITRFQPGTGAMPQVLNNGKCMGCHAVNAQGTVLVADIDDQNGAVNPGGGANTDKSLAPYGNWSFTRPWAAFEIAKVVANPAAPPTIETTMFGADLALTPDGKYVVFGGPAPVTAGGTAIGSPATPGSKYLSLAPVASGMVVATSGLDNVAVDTGMGIMMPAFSPDGSKLAVVEAQYYADNVIPVAGVHESIGYLDFAESSLTFGPTLHKVVDGASAAFMGGGGLAYPSFSPDSTALAFHAGTTSTGCNPNKCDNASPDDGNLYATALASGAPVRLAAADDATVTNDLNDSVEPTFNPVVRGGYSWVVFTSMRAWGNVPWPAGTGTGHINGKRRLWVAAVDPTVGANDPSHPAIYLEGQENTPNMRGFWTLAACIPSAGAAGDDAGTGGADGGTMCTAGYQCCSGFCLNGMCADITMVTCVGVGGMCKTTADCCNAGQVTCQGGVCRPPAQ